MTDNLPTLPTDTTLARLQRATTPEERVKLQHEVGEKINDPRFKRPVPRFLAELPYAGDDEEISDRIALGLLIADDPDAAQDEQGTEGSQSLLGKTVTVWDLRTLASDKEGGWGAFLLLDYTLKGSDEHRIMTTGSKQIITRLVRAYIDGQIPIEGTLTAIDTGSASGNRPLAFITGTKRVRVPGEEPF